MKLKTEKLTVESAGEIDAGDSSTIDASGCTRFLVPMIANASLPDASGVEGMIAYDTTNNKLVMSNGSAWETVTSA